MTATCEAPALAAARDLERALGDPFEADAPVSFAALVAHDEREEPPADAFAALRAWGVHAYLVPRAWGGRLASFDELLALVRVVSRRDLVLTTGLGSTALAAIPVWAWGRDEQRAERGRRARVERVAERALQVSRGRPGRRPQRQSHANCSIATARGFGSSPRTNS